MPSARPPQIQLPRLTLALIAASPLFVVGTVLVCMAMRSPVEVSALPPATAPVFTPHIEVSSPWTRDGGYAEALATVPDAGPTPEAVVTDTLRRANEVIEKTSLHVAAEKPEKPMLVWPIGSTVITSEFGKRADPLRGDRRTHEGVDIHADEGTPVLAAADGVVENADYSRRTGLYVRIAHGKDVFTRYAHLSELAVAAGDEVVAGQVIGKSGATGRVTGPHLHFEVTANGIPQDPLSYDWAVMNPPEDESPLMNGHAAIDVLSGNGSNQTL